MTIAFVHNNKAFLPETEAYCRFFSALGFHCEVVNKDNVGLLHRNVEWRLMGTDLSKPKEGIIKIHEYSSSSVPPARVWKNLTKAFFNAQPDYRLFLNEYVRKSFSFYDKIPFGYRDMGVPAEWLDLPHASSEKIYDFVYLGDMSPVREPERLLNCFSTGIMKEHSLLLIGKNYAQLQSIYQAYPNIHFIGPIAQVLTPTWLRKARYGINFIVDKQPINKQTSTKMLEYIACGLPVISTKYHWVESFQKNNGGSYFWLDQDLSNFNWQQITNFQYQSPDLSAWTWEEQIRKSGVVEFLEKMIEKV
ncbi:MAG: glycosyltransferase [Chitinophagaceae bacterium]|nr:glycosyltransferase [Chitinophagaceae bacterium]